MGARAPDEPHLLYTPLPVRPSFLPSVRPSSERKRGKHERMDWRPPDRRSISVVAGKGRMDAGGKDGMMPIWTETATERAVMLLQGKCATLSP